MTTHIQLFAPANESKPASKMFGIFFIREKRIKFCVFLLALNYSLYKQQKISMPSFLFTLVCFNLSDTCLYDTLLKKMSWVYIWREMILLVLQDSLADLTVINCGISFIIMYTTWLNNALIIYPWTVLIIMSVIVSFIWD